MAYKVLARKWRPKRFQEVIGQSHVTRSLQNAIVREKLGHAYILSGTRGIGKTTVARILGKAIRCEDRLQDGNPCNKCAACNDFGSGSSMNVMEIDGASNNKVDDVRDLIGQVQYLPSFGTKKIYIIDEVHMLTTEAFNALLKTLEEPPEHVVFIFATTEPQKLLGTVLSRCQRFDFRHVDVETLVNHINTIAESEGIAFENQNIPKQIAIQGKGSVRDTLSLMDQVLSYSEDNHVSEETLVLSLGIASSSAVKDLITSILRGNHLDCSEFYRGLLRENVSVKNILIATLDYLSEVIQNIDAPGDLLEAGDLETVSTPELLWIYETLAKDSEWIVNSLSPDKVSEIMLQKICLRRTFFADKSKDKKKTLN